MCGTSTQQLWLADVGRIQNVLDMLLNTSPTAPTVTDVPSTLAVPPTPWYYHNAATGNSTWSPLPPSGRPPPPPLPLGWIAVWDDTYERYYYWNAETRTSVWVPPIPPPPCHWGHRGTEEVREAMITITSDGESQCTIREMCKITTAVQENIAEKPFVSFSGPSSSIQKESTNEIAERLVDPEKILKPTIKKLDPTPWHPEAPPIEPPTGEHCVHRKYWEQLEGLPEDQKILETMD